MMRFNADFLYLSNFGNLSCKNHRNLGYRLESFEPTLTKKLRESAFLICGDFSSRHKNVPAFSTNNNPNPSILFSPLKLQGQCAKNSGPQALRAWTKYTPRSNGAR